jgi:drug/metabolite transporter (DMT)-like permease
MATENGSMGCLEHGKAGSNPGNVTMPSASIHKTMTASDWGLLIILSVLWGGSFLFIGIAVKELPPLTIVASRIALAAAALYLVLRVTGASLPQGRQVWAAFLSMGILNNVIPMSLIVWGQGHITSGLASILNATTPLFTVLVAHVLTVDERLTRQRFIGVIVGFAGVAVMIGAAAFQAWNVSIPAQLAVLAAALSYAFAGVFGRRFRAMGIAPLATAAGQVTASSAILLPLSLIIDRPWSLPAPSAGAVMSLVGLALVSTALAYILFFRLLARAGATNAGLVTFLIPVSAILLGTMFLGETLEARHMAGMALIGAGLLLIDGRLIPAVVGAISARRPATRGNG